MEKKKKKTGAVETAAIPTPASTRPKQNEMPLKGEGVEITTDKQLIDLGDKYIDFKDSRNIAAKGMKDTEAEILKRMAILNLKRFRFGDQIAVCEAGKEHIKIVPFKDKRLPDADTAAITDGSLQ